MAFQAHLECGVGVKLDLPGDLAYGESGTPRGGERRVNDGAGVGRMAHLWYQERIPTSGDEDLMAFVAHEAQVKEDSWRGEKDGGWAGLAGDVLKRRARRSGVGWWGEVLRGGELGWAGGGGPDPSPRDDQCLGRHGSSPETRHTAPWAGWRRAERREEYPNELRTRREERRSMYVRKHARRNEARDGRCDR